MAGTWAAPTPAIPTFVDGATTIVSPLNDLTASFTNLYNYTQGGFRTEKPLCVVYRLKSEGGPRPSVDNLVNWDSVYANTDFMFTASANDTLTVHTPGWYRLSLQVHFDATPAGLRACKIMVNGSAPGTNSVATDARIPVTSSEGTVVFCSALVGLAAGSTILANCYQSSGGASMVITTFSASFLSAEWISPL